MRRCAPIRVGDADGDRGIPAKASWLSSPVGGRVAWASPTRCGPCQRLADYMAEQTGIRVKATTVRHYLIAADIVLSRPQHKVTSPGPEYEVKKRRLKTSATT